MSLHPENGDQFFTYKNILLPSLSEPLAYAIYLHKDAGLDMSEIFRRAQRLSAPFEAFTCVRVARFRQVDPVSPLGIGTEGYHFALQPPAEIHAYPESVGRRMLSAIRQATAYDWKFKHQMDEMLHGGQESKKTINLLLEIAGAEFGRLHALRSQQNMDAFKANAQFRSITYNWVWEIGQPIRYACIDEGLPQISYPKPIDAVSLPMPKETRENEGMLTYYTVMTLAAQPLRQIIGHLLTRPLDYPPLPEINLS